MTKDCLPFGTCLKTKNEFKTNFINLKRDPLKCSYHLKVLRLNEDSVNTLKIDLRCPGCRAIEQIEMRQFF